MVDSLLPLSPLRARLATPRGADRIEALLAAEDAAGAVAALPVTELHQLVHDTGFGDALELIALATPEQIQGCLDIDMWERDQVQLEASKPWLAALIEAGYDKLAQVWEGLDSELRALLVARTTQIWDLSLGEEPDDADRRPVMVTPDSYFAISFTADDDTARLVHRLIEDLYRADPSGALARHTLMAAHGEPMTELAEMSYRWRSGRMADMGYADFYEALVVFRPLDPASVKLDEGTEDRFGDTMDGDTLRPGALPVPIAERVVGHSFLARAMDQIQSPEEIERLELALVVLVNKVLAAVRVSPRDAEAVAIGADHATATLALGLEAVSQGNLERAAQALTQVSLSRLHRVGHTIVLRLAFFARQLIKRAATAGPPVDALLAALCAPRPLYARELDDPAGSGPRAFESLADVRVVAETLTRLALRIAVADSLGVNLDAMASAPEPRPMLDDHVRTALVRAMLGQEFGAAPLAMADILRFVDEAMDTAEGGKAGAEVTASVLKEEPRLAAARALVARLDDTRVSAAREFLPELIKGWFADIEDALGHLPSDPDPRFVDRVLVAAENP